MISQQDEEQYSQMVKKVVEELQATDLHVQLMKAAQAEVARSNFRLSDMKKGVMNALSRLGWEKKVRNAVFQCIQKYTSPQHPLSSQEHYKEPVAYIRRAQMNWEKRILKSLNSMCTELSVPLARKRPEKEQKELSGRWTEIGTEEPDLSQFRPVYAPKDFLEVISSLKNPNMQGVDDPLNSYLGIIQVPLKVKDIQELRLAFSEMSINQCQTGCDDTEEIPPELFESDRIKFSKKVLQMSHSPLAQEFAKKGVPLDCRGQIWCQILDIDVDDVDILYYEQLRANVLHHDLLIDSLVFKDVKLTATNDDQYFVFEDYLYQVLLPFSRDTYVLQNLSTCSACPPKSFIRGKLGVEEFAVAYPPNGVIPFHGFAMYVAPFCYVYNDPVKLYYVFREFYVRYFHRLHILSSDPQGIVAVSLLFETLLQTHEPNLFYHLKSVGVQPLRIAFKWLIRAFSGYLSSDQVLLLWDRVLAYNSLEILAVLAVAIFSFRKTNLQQVQTYNAAEAVLADISTLKVIPLIQLSLFSA